MKEEDKKKEKRRVEREPFGPLMHSMNEFFAQSPVKKMLNTFDDFFDKSPFVSSIPIEMYETDTELIVSADLPGMKRDQIHIDYSDNHITISVEHNEKMEETNEKKHYYMKKQQYKHASRTVQLPYPIVNNNVKATYRDGVLKIHIPKQKKNRLSIED